MTSRYNGNGNANLNLNANLKAAIKRVKNHACMSSVEREQTRYKVSTGTGTGTKNRDVICISTYHKRQDGLALGFR